MLLRSFFQTFLLFFQIFQVAVAGSEKKVCCLITSGTRPPRGLDRRRSELAVGDGQTHDFHDQTSDPRVLISGLVREIIENGRS